MRFGDYDINDNLTKEQWESCYAEIQCAYIDGWLHTLPDGRIHYGSCAVRCKPISRKILPMLVTDAHAAKKDTSDYYRGCWIFNIPHIIHEYRLKFEDGYKDQYNLYALNSLDEQYKDLCSNFEMAAATKLLQSIKDYTIASEEIKAYVPKLEHLISGVNGIVNSLIE